MTKQKPKVPNNADDKEQSKLFIETALERETDESGKTLERAFKQVTNRQRGKGSGRSPAKP